MKKKLIKIGAVLMAALILISVLATSAFAYVPHITYNFNFYGDPVETPSGYSAKKVYYAKDMGIDSLEKAIDIFVSTEKVGFEEKEYDYIDADGQKYIHRVFILDYVGADNVARIHILDKNLKLIKTLTTLKYKGNDYTMRLPESVTVDEDGYIYVCDTGKSNVLKLNNKNNEVIDQIVGTPTSKAFSGDFKPSKVAIAKNKSFYVISSGTLGGIMEFNKDGEFLRYFGAPEVELDVMEMVTQAWRRIYRSVFGGEVDKSFASFEPTEFVNLVVDEHGFVYAVIAAAGGDNTNQLKKMNFLGNNILDPNAKSTQKISSTLSETYGDLVRRSTGSQGNIFRDVAVDEDGFITMLDTNLRKIFEYDSEGNMTFVYGAQGNQEGLLQKPVAIAKLGKKTVVLDSHFGSVTVFDLTQHGKTLHKAVIEYDKGLYDEAEEYWLEVLKNDANCELAHIGIGKVYYQNARYEEALEHFELANDRMNYENTFSLYREQVIADHFGLIMTVIVALIVLWVVWKIFGKTIKEAIKNKKQGGGDEDEILE